MDTTENYDFFFENSTFDITILPPEIQPTQIFALVTYGLVFLLGVPGNALVVWVTGFCMPPSVTSVWFLNLALADLLCCLSLPLLMVPLAHDNHWHFGPVACTLVSGLFYLVMYCSVLQLVVISVDRWLLVTKPVWCQNHRRPWMAVLGCVAVWVLALVSSIPQFVYSREKSAGEEKRHCETRPPPAIARAITGSRFLTGFLLPFLVIVGCHLVVYSRAQCGLTRGRTRSKRTAKVILAVVLGFVLCWLPLHIVDFVVLVTPEFSDNAPKVYLASALTLSLAYFNSCLNPLLYVCLGRSFKDTMNRSLRNLLPFISEEPTTRPSMTTDTRSTSNGKELTRV